jgi:hypothetical protein
MSRAIVINLGTTVLRAVVANGDGGSVSVDATISVPVERADLISAERELVHLLEPHHPHKAKILVAVPSPAIKWQSLTLPPCPPEDLPALVKLQLEMESTGGEDEVGYDFVTLGIVPDKPQRVLATVLKTAELARVRNFSRISNLKVESIVPVAMGWEACGNAIRANADGMDVFLGLHQKEVTLWAKRTNRPVLFRQFQLAEELENPASATAIGAQLRRTMLSLSQEGILTTAARIGLVGSSAAALDGIASSLRTQLTQSVEVLSLPIELVGADSQNVVDGEFLPLLGLASQAVGATPPVIDFLHPKRPPAPQSNNRTYVLAALAAGLLLAVLGWQGYATLNDPLWQAEKLQDELAVLKKELAPFEAEERDAMRLSDWLSATPNVLTELTALGQDWRPEPLESPKFALPNDAVLKRWEMINRRIALDGNVTSSNAVQTLENRLRDETHRVRRQESEPVKDGGQYPWHLEVEVEVVDGAASAEGQQL